MTHYYACAKCGAMVDQPIIVPPYESEAAFRCEGCVTPQDRALIAASEARERAECITWLEVRRELGATRYTKFQVWMDGQTVGPYGVYRTDYYRFLHNLPIED